MINPLTKEFLLKNSDKSDDLSINGCTVQLADGSNSTPINVFSYSTKNPIKPYGKNIKLPIVVFKGQNIEIFIDLSHPIFRSYSIQPESLVAGEVAQYIFDRNRSISERRYVGEHSLSYLEWLILSDKWSNKLEDNIEKVKDDIKAFFQHLRTQLPSLFGVRATDFYNDLSETQTEALTRNMLEEGKDIGQLGEMIQSGEYLSFLNEDTIIEIFRKAPEYFFDGKFWSDTYSEFTGFSDQIVEDARSRIKSIYLNCLDDITRYQKYKEPEPTITKRARTSLDILLKKLVY